MTEEKKGEGGQRERKKEGKKTERDKYRKINKQKERARILIHSHSRVNEQIQLQA